MLREHLHRAVAELFVFGILVKFFVPDRLFDDDFHLLNQNILLQDFFLLDRDFIYQLLGYFFILWVLVGLGHLVKALNHGSLGGGAF